MLLIGLLLLSILKNIFTYYCLAFQSTKLLYKLCGSTSPYLINLSAILRHLSLGPQFITRSLTISRFGSHKTLFYICLIPIVFMVKKYIKKSFPCYSTSFIELKKGLRKF